MTRSLYLYLKGDASGYIYVLYDIPTATENKSSAFVQDDNTATTLVELCQVLYISYA